jgi:predicted transcriptional regulator
MRGCRFFILRRCQPKEGGMESNNKQSKLTVADAVRELENGTLSPKQFKKSVLGEYAIFMKSRGYTNLEIGEILQITSRTVQRYVQKIRENNQAICSSVFQKQFLNEVVGNFWAQYYRLVKLSYSDRVKEADKIKAISEANQVLYDMAALLIKVGYLNSQNAIADFKKGLLSSRIDLLTPEEKKEYAKAIPGIDEECFKKKCEKFAEVVGSIR